MTLEESVAAYEKSIRKLAEKNGVEYEVMLENWMQKYNEFDTITGKQGFSESIELYPSDSVSTLAALTINGSILLVSEPDEESNRKVRYQSIKIRNDDSKNVPEIFTGRIKNDVQLSKSVIFDKVIETSAIIKIKLSEDCDWNSFDKVADAMTVEFTRKFEMIDNMTITKRLNELEE